MIRKRIHHRYLIFCLPLLALSYLPLNKWLVARNIDCYTQFGTCPTGYQAELSGFHNASLLRPPRSKIMDKLKQFSDISQVSLYRRLPSTLVVSISLRQPIGAVAPSVLSAQTFAADATGTVYAPSEDLSLPLLVVNNLPAIPLQLDPLQTASLKILKTLLLLSPERINGELSGQTLTVNFPNITVLIDVKRPPESWYPSLQLIFTRSKISSKSPHLIDMRYTNPIIKY